MVCEKDINSILSTKVNHQQNLFYRASQQISCDVQPKPSIKIHFLLLMGTGHDFKLIQLQPQRFVPTLWKALLCLVGILR